MNSDKLGLCRSYVTAHTAEGHEERPVKHALASMTVSRETGTPAARICTRLVEELNRGAPDGAIPWTFFDRDLMETVLKDHDLPTRIARFFPEAYWSEVDTTIGSILRRHPDSWTIFEQTVETIRKLGGIGHSIIAGRGSNFITRDFPNVLHVRLIGSFQTRRDFLCEDRGLTKREAESHLRTRDRDRRAYARQHFDADIADPREYALVINTDRLAETHVVRLLRDHLRRLESDLAKTSVPV